MAIIIIITMHRSMINNQIVYRKHDAKHTHSTHKFPFRNGKIHTCIESMRLRRGWKRPKITKPIGWHFFVHFSFHLIVECVHSKDISIQWNSDEIQRIIIRRPRCKKKCSHNYEKCLCSAFNREKYGKISIHSEESEVIDIFDDTPNSVFRSWLHFYAGSSLSAR